jgi:hypothetical protein
MLIITYQGSQGRQAAHELKNELLRVNKAYGQKIEYAGYGWNKSPNSWAAVKAYNHGQNWINTIQHMRWDGDIEGAKKVLNVIKGHHTMNKANKRLARRILASL